MQEKRYQLLDMQLHGQFEKAREKQEDHEASQNWSKHSNLKRGTENVIMITQG